VVRGPENARAILHAVKKKNGQSVLTWATLDGPVDTIEYITYPRKVRMSDEEPLVYKAWILLMSKVDVILRPPDGPGDNILQQQAREIAQHQARGIAEVLAILMDPFLGEPDAVVRAAVKKYKEPTYEVPGLGTFLWDPLFNADGSPRNPMPLKKAVAKAVPLKTKPKVDNKSTKKLTAEEALGIREAVGSGMFTEEDVASMFKVSIATVKEAVGTS
jgi:hypothetical protein